MKACICMSCRLNRYFWRPYDAGSVGGKYGINYHADGYQFDSEEKYKRYLKLKAFW